jgi:LacI family transcriptional regulator
VVDETVRSSGRIVMLGTCNADASRQEGVLASLREYRPDGVIVCPVDESTEASLRAIADSGVPIVMVSREIAGLRADFVGVDDRRATELAVGHLADLGHRRIAYVGGNAATSNGRLRHQSFAETAAARGLSAEDAAILPGGGDKLTGLDGIARAMTSARPPTGVVCFNDSVAFGVMHGLQKLGLRPGVDVSVVGSDDVADAAVWVPPLTTVHNQHIEMGRLAAEMMVRRVSEPDLPPRRIVLEPRLVVRGSTGAPVA